jgi:hypothetical protein
MRQMGELVLRQFLELNDRDGPEDQDAIEQLSRHQRFPQQQIFPFCQPSL